jgi:hypothetical protein
MDDDKYGNLFDIVYKQNRVMRNHIEDQKEVYSTDDQRNVYITDMNDAILVSTTFVFYFYYSFLFVALGVAIVKRKSAVRVLFYGIFFSALPHLLFLIEGIVVQEIIPFFSRQYIYS